jgi:hypothetical protein
LAQDIASGKLVFDAIYPGIALVLLADAVLFLGPLCIFSRKLWKCRVKGMSDYNAFAERYVAAFDRKWLGPDAAQAKRLLGTADIQALADLSTSVDIIRDMRTVPVSSTLLIHMAVAALLPLLPLALFEYPARELLVKFIERLSGL